MRPAARSALEAALVVVVRLPDDLATFRRAHVANAERGVPAHVTLLYPFDRPGRSATATYEAIARAARAEPRFTVTLGPSLGWAEVTALAATPAEPFVRLIRRLASTFPDRPPYAGRIAVDEIVPHVTLADDGADEPSWAGSSFAAGDVDAVSWIAQEEDGRWRTAATFPLGD